MRNHACPHYDECLGHAALIDAPTLSCEKCQHRNEKAPAVIDEVPLAKLLAAVFRPKIWLAYLRREK